MRRIVALGLTGILCLLTLGSYDALGAAEPAAVLVVKASSDSGYRTELPVDSAELLKAIQRKNRPSRQDVSMPLTDTFLILKRKDTAETEFSVDSQGGLRNGEGAALDLPPEVQGELHRLRLQARKQHYGEMTPWSDVKRKLPLKSVSTVKDLETGLSFRVQRRAGSKHADMQPLTKADTEVMKEIYGGEWSWRRRAVLVEYEGHRFAGSMHGMPHGGDGIPDNGFSGHFCIHFHGSTTHGSGNTDPDHQWMIRKAAGRWDETFAAASPGDIIESFLVAVNQHDPELLKHGFARMDHPQLVAFLGEMKEIKAIRIAASKDKRKPASWDGLLSADVPVELTLHRSGMRPEKQVFTFLMRRAGPDAPWKIDGINRISPHGKGMKSP
ncbi:hypothetical protein O9H85_24805 [Paenibacillus filicis]|uniref:Copper amine oxidase-like N-terminal domain-containing protein n=1 Tax=Paenibacillus gyeongsangnamensis TaxID=3388067 RepID=A0ABT4QFA9_9BACL|nr:hypothetical protein [Paenibacillus filicis]MCZ8515568.1 hypothetical protein [Paenibacillus filicis]